MTVISSNLPLFKELPTIDLYIDQTVGLVNQYTENLTDQPLTKSMINSYVKKKIISKPVTKKYDQNQLAMIIIVSLLKPFLSLTAISQFLSTSRIDLFYDKLVTTINQQISESVGFPANEELPTLLAELVVTRRKVDNFIKE
ncbi:DUF1836 domain-containing protein [Lentilactobacillus sp. Marseille-Q4993]|uniref:DUF1836 domain-containing protein n=1 Tax=Lentilactobacillus sp. Marseille-Q4993 TaxID=3039492 RepID=UPI0024BC8B36|nr:DUF1836 domain-containing protein [Lentilactobacillus sp. Marseille-Q4993]